MSNDMTVGVLIFMVLMVFGTMIGTYLITTTSRGYVVIPSTSYCEDNGYVRAAKP
jgi:hypothetical protein